MYYIVQWFEAVVCGQEPKRQCVSSTNNCTVVRTERLKQETLVPLEPAIGNDLLMYSLSCHYMTK